jgi:hypothetical protein
MQHLQTNTLSFEASELIYPRTKLDCTYNKKKTKVEIWEIPCGEMWPPHMPTNYGKPMDWEGKRYGPCGQGWQIFVESNIQPRSNV